MPPKGQDHLSLPSPLLHNILVPLLFDVRACVCAIRSSGGSRSEAIQQSGGLLVHRSYFLYPVSPSLSPLYVKGSPSPSKSAPYRPPDCADIRRSTTRTTPSYLSRFSKPSTNSTPRTGTTSQIQVGTLDGKYNSG